MKAIKKFENFIRRGIVKKQSPDNSRSEFLVKESEKTYNSLLRQVSKIGIEDENANGYVKLCHDVLTELIRAKMLLDGYNASGFGAHEAEISYLRNLGFNESEVQFADQIRFFRNGILYYGTVLDKEYAEKVLSFTKINYFKLKDLIK
ncbi:hypothetical protein HYT24_02340 [Candidatus Pacearchaeota archaeon]|nr:hypothetical protein [Candidatus Pacearchaeota archaeon]